MRINHQNTAEYNAKVAELFLEVDYALFQEHATSLIQQYHDKTSLEQWDLFCRYLNELSEKQSVLLLLMQLAFRCFEAPLTHSHLAQLITLAQQLISVYGVGVYRDLLEAKIPDKDKQLPLYLTALQLLVDLYEVKGIADAVKKHLPNLQGLIAYLHSAQNECLSSLYSKRDVDEVLGYFATPNDITKFPLDKPTLMTFKEDYLGICAQMEKVKKFPQAELKTQFLENSRQWRDKQNPEAKQIIVAIMVETIRRFYKILPYDTQIIAFLALIRDVPHTLRGRIAQIKAGEGKSTVFAMLVAFKAGQGCFVDLITSSGYLAIRDYKKYRPFLKALGITSSHISYGRPTQAHFHAQVLYGTNSDFEFALLRDGLNESKLRYSYPLGENQLKERTFDVVFIDEVDNMMLDTIGAARIATAECDAQAWVYKPILDFVQDKLKNERLTQGAVGELRAYLQTRIHQKYKSELLKMPDAKLLRWLNSAQVALYQKKEGRDYVVKKDIEIVDYANTGRIQEGCQWQHGIHQFTQVKHEKTPDPESLTGASVSHPSYFGQYKEVYGLTGTMGELAEREEIQEIYFVESFDVPPHLPCKRKTLPARILPNASKQNEAILLEIKRIQKEGRPLLILYESIAESEIFKQFLDSKGIPHQLLNEMQGVSEDYIIGRAGRPKMVTVATNTAGRGTDIILSPESKKAGGLHQIFTFYPENSRVEEQGVARGARQGQEGSCGMILNEQDSRIISLLLTSFSALNAWIRAESEQQKMDLLNRLRTDKICHESRQRRYTAKLESLYFSYLNKFFVELASLRNNMKNAELQDTLKHTCLSELDPNISAYPLNMKNARWVAIFRNARVLLANQALGKPVDWSSFLADYREAFIEHFTELWSVFYSQLSDQVEGKTIPEAEKIIQKAYESFNLSAIGTSEVVMATLAALLYKASSLSIEQEKVLFAQTSTIGFFSQKPTELYAKAVRCIDGKNYKEALKFCEMAMEGFGKVKGEYSLEMGNCYSTQASCYRDLESFDESLAACEKAIDIFSTLDIEKKDKKAAESLPRTMTKYQSCLEKSGFELSKLYPGAITLYKEKKYHAASCRLIHLIKKSSELTPVEKGTCYSTLASCYRELGEKEKAIEACENAILAFEAAKWPQAKMEPVLKKLKELKSSRVSNLAI